MAKIDSKIAHSSACILAEIKTVLKTHNELLWTRAENMVRVSAKGFEEAIEEVNDLFLKIRFSDDQTGQIM